MRKFILILSTLFFCLTATSSFARSMEQERALCLARNALARAQCKNPMEFSYVGPQRGNIHIYNGLYGAKYTDFYCKIESNEIIIMSKNKLFRRSVKYYIDENECGVIDYYPASCTDKKQIRCCFPKSAKELKEDKEAEFWQRSVPDLLKEDQKEALKVLEEKLKDYSKASESTQEGQSAE